MIQRRFFGSKDIHDGVMLNAPRRFYVPRYYETQRLNPLYDGRVTVCWEPLIITDTNGKAPVKFYASDRQTNLEVIINGIVTGSGLPGNGKALIKI